MENAGVILDEVTRKWRDVEEIVRTVGAKFDRGADDVREGVEAVIGELASQWFVDVEATGEADENEYEVNLAGPTAVTEGQDDDWTPLGDFYRQHGLPSELHLDLTDGCNERCVHCYLPKGGAHFLETRIAEKVLKEFREAQGLTVFVSGGECMLHRDFAAILRRARKLDLNIVVMSNLTLCDGKMVDLLKEVEPQFVNVSLYAVTESIHDSITQVPGSCRKTKGAIDALLAAGVPIRIATPFMRENKGCVEELKAYARERHVHLIPDAEIFGPIDHSCSNRAHALSLSELEELVSENREVFAKDRAEPGRCVPDVKVCDIGDARLNLDAEGRYYPCDGFHGAIIGDARKDSLWDVWTGEALDKLRALKNRDFGECGTCENRAWCKVCPMRNFNETGDMFRHAPWRCGAARVWRRTFGEQRELGQSHTEAPRDRDAEGAGGQFVGARAARPRELDSQASRLRPQGVHEGQMEG
jgi:radical SAM protein with 4Fe4S-binding SPASM domain